MFSVSVFFCAGNPFLRSWQQKNVVEKDVRGAIMALGHYFNFKCY